jgi:hypothetical protein
MIFSKIEMLFAGNLQINGFNEVVAFEKLFIID